MNKKQWLIPLAALLSFGLAGCSDNNRNTAGVNDSSKNLLRPVGYYSNENHPSNHHELLRDNDGAMTEIMDHTMGDEDAVTRSEKRRLLQTRDENGNPKNPTTPLAKTDRNFFQRDNRFSTSDMNYHGHLNKRTGTMGTATEPKVQETITDQIRNKVRAVDNVRSIRSVAYGNTVMISVKLADNRKASQTKQAIEKAVKPYANGKNVQVITDEGSLGRDRNHNNEVPQ
ncbi:YhcN/YlaJ family sporulation lipoprotein [Bacillus sp. JJ1764]|uniref:YhcN/YlaJ family sporulation lipoprotein n=1 Tax=Bacillus sp. JJ1764 TaxID=3122964 RepID=UPI0030000591